MKMLILILVASTLTGCVIRPWHPHYYDGYYYHYPSPHYQYDYGGRGGRGGWRR